MSTDDYDPTEEEINQTFDMAEEIIKLTLPHGGTTPEEVAMAMSAIVVAMSSLIAANGNDDAHKQEGAKLVYDRLLNMLETEDEPETA